MSNVQFLFVLAPHKKEDVPYLQFYIEKVKVNAPVYIDEKYIFLEENPFIPKESLFHTLLLDSLDRVVLVGNPIRNSSIEQMAFDIVR